ncbi:MAG: methionyl-tRNA formyltransferase [Candidatus Endobugula sp.]|jgi:methionyl-tRNA formyltransferase
MNYVLVTSRSWNEVLAKRLTEMTGDTFHLITNKDDLTLDNLNEIRPCYVFFPHWSHIIPEEIHAAYECVIFHMTDLPYGRGGSPLQNLILRGHKNTQVSALRCISELDAGPIYMKRSLSLSGSAAEIFLHASDVIERMIFEIVHTKPRPEPQQGTPFTFRRRTPDESSLDEADITNLNDFFDFIRMLDAEGYPKAFLALHGHRLELSDVRYEQEQLVGSFMIRRTGPDLEGKT